MDREDGGLSYTEGHRAIPAWEMLESGDWLVTTLFDRVYLRKPPGMAWAIAGSSAVFGQTEFAARFVSAVCSTAMVLVAYGFARRWFGARWALSAGIGSPDYWITGLMDYWSSRPASIPNPPIHSRSTPRPRYSRNRPISLNNFRNFDVIHP